MEGVHAAGDLVRLPRDDARKLLVVMRARTGDTVEIVDSGGRLFSASLVCDGAFADASLQEEIAAPGRTSLAISLAQGLPKGQKMDYVVEKATELGLAAIVPFVAARTIGPGDRAGKVERWRRLAKSAAQQCGRSAIPDVVPPLAYGDLVATFASYDVVLMPWELAAPIALREVLPELLGAARHALIVIGPEGGFSQDEARAAADAGANLISLGSRILRTETAGIVTASALLYASGDL